MRKQFKTISFVLMATALCIPGNIAGTVTPEKPLSHVTQQNGKITGIVEDVLGPVTGASVSVKGTTNGTITDLDGNFTLENVPAGSTISISFVGYVTQEIIYTGQTFLSIDLKEDTQLLGEVVVTALGMSREKKALGYAITELSGDEIARVNSANPINGLQGKVAGVQINQGASGPQSANRILIRGNSSLGNNNQPIFVIDGVIIDNTVNESAQWGAEMDFGNDIKNLNSDDFESVSVLKGAAATALYGSRAANGVILITTKKGKAGEGIGVTLSHSMTWDNVYKFPDFQNRFGPGETTVWYDPSTRQAQTSRHFGPEYDGLPYQQENSPEKWLYMDRSPDNIKQMYQTGTYSNTNAAVQGGDEKGSFRISYSHLKSEGITFNNEYSRNSFSFNATRNISRILKAEAGVAWVRSDAKNPTFQGGDKSPIYDFTYRVPLTYNTAEWLNNYTNTKGDGYNQADPSSYTKFIYDIMENEYGQIEDNIRGNMKLTFDFTDWLSLNLSGDMNKLFITNEKKIRALEEEAFKGAEYRLNKNEKHQYKITAMLNARKRFNDFGVNGSIAVEQWDTKTNYHKSSTQGGLRVPGLFDITNTVNPSTQETRINTDRKRINSTYAFVNLDWRNQVYLDITGRNDWSSSLIYKDGSGTVSYFYPSVSASWLPTETFTEQLPNAISFTKVRASYAIVGNDCAPYLTGIGYYKIHTDRNTYENPLTGGNYPFYAFDSNNLRNLDLKPEKQHSIELGLEMRFVDNRFGFDFAWYKTNTKNQILALSQPKESGMEKRWINAGNIQNSGIELMLTATPIRNRDWNWDINVNLTHNRNKIIELTEGVYTYEVEGSGMELFTYATVGGAYGDIYGSQVYSYDENGNKLLNADGSWVHAGTPTKVGSIQPKLLGGLSSTLSYKEFSLGIVLDARFGGDIASGSYYYGMWAGKLESSLYGRTAELGGLPRNYTLANGDIVTVNDGMIPEGVFAPGVQINDTNVGGWTYQQAIDAGLVEPLSAYAYYDNMYDWKKGVRDEAIMKCSWIALREISFRWNLPKRWVNQAYMQNVSVGVVARNLGYLYNSLPDNIHPEGLPSNRSSAFVERGGTPYTRSFGFNINVAF